jgi:glycerol uptake facilitator-like aquaporin
MFVPKDACFAPAMNVSNGQLFGFEFFTTFILISTVFATAVESSGSAFQGIAPLAIGLSLFAGAQASGTYTGACANPARLIGPYAAIGCDNTSKGGLYLGAQFLAAAVAALIYLARFQIGQMHCDRKPAEEDSMHKDGGGIIKRFRDKQAAAFSTRNNKLALANSGSQVMSAASHRGGFLSTDL